MNEQNDIDISDGKEWERDLQVNYVVQSGSAKGLTFRVRGGQPPVLHPQKIANQAVLGVTLGVSGSPRRGLSCR
ncbi:OprD family outer membrane porin [Pseudomonas aeruginosa]|uniref:OprD family outer membrane porin n=1 Tax=Pseudomonas aeruginosa TaxID=287 RepID=UPI0012994F14